MQHLLEELWKLQPGSKMRDFNKDAGENLQLVKEIPAAVAKNAGTPSPVGSPRAMPTAAAGKAGVPPFRR